MKNEARYATVPPTASAVRPATLFWWVFLMDPGGPDAGSSPAESDLEDVRRTLEGDGESYRALVERHQAQVGRMMWRFDRDLRTHEELVQDVFVEAYRSLDRYRGDAPFSHWLARIATRVGYRHWKEKARARRRTVPLEEWDEDGTAAPGEMTPSEAAEWVHHLLSRLPPRDRLVLTLRFLEDRTVEETARLIGWSPSMVKVQTWRARRKLETLVGKTKEDDRS